MRPAAQVDEVALAVQRDRLLVGRNRGDDFGLVLFADGLEERDGFVARPISSRCTEIIVWASSAMLLFDGGEVFGGERRL